MTTLIEELPARIAKLEKRIAKLEKTHGSDNQFVKLLKQQLKDMKAKKKT